MPQKITNDIETDQKMRELIILFILANSIKKISILHLQKEAFLLWKFDNQLKDSMHFISHLKGPFSRDIEETIEYPMALINCWKTYKPSRNDDLSGGFIKITSKGITKYNKIEKEIKKSEIEELLHLLTASQIVTHIYNKLSVEELLLLIYDTYPNFTKKSSIYEKIYSNKDIISKQLIAKELIDEKRCFSNQRR